MRRPRETNLVIFDAEVYLGPHLFGGPAFGEDDLLAALDAAGIDRAVVCPARPPDYHLGPANDRVSEAVRRHPDRLVGFARVDPHQDSAVSELRRTVEDLGLRGLLLHPWEELFAANDPRLDALLEYARTRGLVVEIAGGYPAVSHATQIAALARRFADVRILATHGGQINISGRGLYGATQLLRTCPNVYLQTSGVYREDWLEDTARDLGCGRLVFGSGAPYFDLRFEVERIRRLHLSEQDRNAIAGGTLARLLAPLRPAG